MGVKPIVAIVGRPNVGKSTLFNRLVGKRISIVEDTPSVTRDRIFADGEWCGKTFTMIDTGGIEPYSDDVILSQMRAQAQLAIEKADVIIFVVDIKTGVTASDSDVATKKYVDDRTGSGLPIVDNTDDGKVLTVVDGAWDKAEASGSLEPVVITLGVDDIALNRSNFRFTLSDNAVELVHEALMSAYHNKRPVYFDLTYLEAGSEVVMYLNGYASIHGYHYDVDSVHAVFSTWNRTNTLIYDFVAEAWYYGSDPRVAISLKARS